MTDLCGEIRSNREIRTVVLHGEGDAFSPISDEFEAGSERRSIAEPVARLDLPVIAAIDGDAIGQGLELALAWDLRISTEASHFGFPHIQKGLIPWDGGTQRLPRLVGRGKGLEMILTSQLIGAHEWKLISIF